MESCDCTGRMVDAVGYRVPAAKNVGTWRAMPDGGLGAPNPYKSQIRRAAAEQTGEDNALRQLEQTAQQVTQLQTAPKGKKRNPHA